MELLIYVLHGTWYTQDTDVAEVLGVSGDIAPLPEGLCRIADTKAKDCVEMSGQLQEERGDGAMRLWTEDGDMRSSIFRNIRLPFRKWRRGRLEGKTRRRMTCRRCGSDVQPERDKWLRKEYPYYCPKCDEDMYSFECMELWQPDNQGDVRPKASMGERRKTMRDKSLENNGACVIGKIMLGARYSHEAYGERFYRVDILTCRASGVTDKVPLMVSESVADMEKDYLDGMVEIAGQFRSYNRKEDGRSHLELSVFVQGIRRVDERYIDYESNNRICLKGYLCKAPVYRKTPLGREIADILLAVNRPYGKSDYIPCICWGKDAVLASRLDVGSAVEVTGRIQSREYRKELSETEDEMRVAYEVSVRRMETVDVQGGQWGGTGLGTRVTADVPASMER